MNASVQTIAPRPIVRPGAWLWRGGLLGIWLLLLIFIVYPLLMLLSRPFFNDGQLSLQALLAAVTAPSGKSTGEVAVVLKETRPTRLPVPARTSCTNSEAAARAS